MQFWGRGRHQDDGGGPAQPRHDERIPGAERPITSNGSESARPNRQPRPSFAGMIGPVTPRHEAGIRQLPAPRHQILVHEAGTGSKAESIAIGGRLSRMRPVMTP